LKGKEEGKRNGEEGHSFERKEEGKNEGRSS
jgi:hypothetical protein